PASSVKLGLPFLNDFTTPSISAKISGVFAKKMGDVTPTILVASPFGNSNWTAIPLTGDIASAHVGSGEKCEKRTKALLSPFCRCDAVVNSLAEPVAVKRAR